MATPSILIVPDRYKSGVLYSQLPETGAVDFGVTRATPAFRTNASGVSESVASGVPRLDYPAAGGCPALLVEPAATNLILRSEEFDNASWFSSIGGASVLPNQAIAPNGQNQMDLITFTGVGQNLIQTVAVLNATQYTFSVWLATTSGTQTVQIGGIAIGVFDTVTVTTTPTRFTITSTTTATSRFPGILSTGASSILAWGAQLELGSNATSYIPTTTVAVTRNADVISKTGVSGFIGQTEGTIYAEVDIRTFSNLGVFLTISDGNERLQVYKFTDSKIYFDRVSSTQSGQTSVGSNALTAGIFKVAVAYKSGDTTMYINGAQVVTTQTQTFAFSSLTKINIGSNRQDGSQFNDRIRAAAIYTTRLSNTELAALTTL